MVGGRSGGRCYNTGARNTPFTRKQDGRCGAFHGRGDGKQGGQHQVCFSVRGLLYIRRTSCGRTGGQGYHYSYNTMETRGEGGGWVGRCVGGYAYTYNRRKGDTLFFDRVGEDVGVGGTKGNNNGGGGQRVVPEVVVVPTRVGPYSCTNANGRRNASNSGDTTMGPRGLQRGTKFAIIVVFVGDKGLPHVGGC